ncbi:MAG: cytochrome b/b6 domain-containing protein [Chromatiales bacterium]|jgi:cytochrome b|nr:cytochrome b/b6 domain-containing protein [Chromatiales bacterium]
MERKLVYDLPTRAFHWVFAGLFITAFTIAQTIDDDTAAFSWHMLAGLALGPVLLLRVLWGLAGTRHARFSDFVLAPGELRRYLRGIFTGDRTSWAGHNPASSWAAVGMMGLALAQVLTGWLMASGPDPEAFEDLHELSANALIILVGLHIAGVALHTLRHRDMLGRSMVDGRKANVTDGEAIRSPRSAFGLLFIALVAAFALQLWNNFDPGQRVVRILGTTLQLGEDGQPHAGPAGDEDAKGARHDDD